jgi:hypothetical protein
MLLNKFFDLFKLDDGINLERRKVVKTAGALAALSFVSIPTVELLLEKTKNIQAQLDNCLLENQILYLKEPLIIGFSNTIIRNCTFIAMNDMPYMVKVSKNVNSCRITDCNFKSKNYAASIALKFDS